MATEVRVERIWGERVSGLKREGEVERMGRVRGGRRGGRDGSEGEGRVDSGVAVAKMGSEIVW